MSLELNEFNTNYNFNFAKPDMNQNKSRQRVNIRISLLTSEKLDLIFRLKVLEFWLHFFLQLTSFRKLQSSPTNIFTARVEHQL